MPVRGTRRVRGAWPIGAAGRHRGAALCLGAVLAACAVATGCAGGAPTTSIALQIKDMNLRSDGAECSGTDSLQYLHADATYRVEDADHAVIATGALPAGVARPGLGVDLGNAVRIPTMCVLEFSFPSAPAAGTGAAAWLVVPPGAPIAVRAGERTGTLVAQLPEQDTDPTVGGATEGPATRSTTAGGATDASPAGGTAVPSAGTSADAVPAPTFSGATIDGGMLRIDQLWAAKPVVLVFFTSWCETCGKRQDAISALAAEYGATVNFVGVSADQKAEDLQRFLTAHPIEYPVISDPDRRIWRAYAVAEPPFVALIGKGGTLVRGWPGGATAEDIRAVLDRAGG